MGKVHRLSRRLDWKVGVENDNENQKLIIEEWIHSLTKVVIKGLEVDILEKIKIARRKDKDAVRVIEKMKKVEVKVLKGNEWQIKEDLVLKKEKVYMLKDEKLSMEIIWLHYNVLAAGHGGK